MFGKFFAKKAKPAKPASASVETRVTATRVRAVDGGPLDRKRLSAALAEFRAGNDKDIGALTNHDTGEPLGREEAMSLFETITSPDLKFEVDPEAEANMAEAGITPEDIKAMMLAAAKKAALSS